MQAAFACRQPHLWLAQRAKLHIIVRAANSFPSRNFPFRSISKARRKIDKLKILPTARKSAKPWSK
jgi:hypothetical protein